MIPIALATIRNIRDLGNTQTSSGQRIRPGCLIRSAHLGGASPDDIAKLKSEHRLRTVIDVRTAKERKEQPDRAEGLEYLPLPIIEDLKAGITHEKQAEGELFPDMAYLYREMMKREGNKAGFRRALTAIFSHDFASGAVLWHCTEGKDRCGMTAALTLEALGVDRDTILSDYLATNRTNLPRAQAVYERLLPLRGEAFARSVYLAYIADERYLQAAWDAMGKDYLRKELCIPDALIQSFRAQVLE